MKSHGAAITEGSSDSDRCAKKKTRSEGRRVSRFFLLIQQRRFETFRFHLLYLLLTLTLNSLQTFIWLWFTGHCPCEPLLDFSFSFNNCLIEYFVHAIYKLVVPIGTFFFSFFFQWAMEKVVRVRNGKKIVAIR